jgi:hypothetical protein
LHERDGFDAGGDGAVAAGGVLAADDGVVGGEAGDELGAGLVYFVLIG